MEVSEAGNTVEPDKIDFVRSDIEIVDDVIAHRLRENKQIVCASAGECVVARPSENRRPWRVGLDIVAETGGTRRTISISPGLSNAEQRCTGVGGRGENRERA